MALKGFMWACITVAAAIIGGAIVVALMLLAAYLERHPNHAGMADSLNYAIAGGVSYWLADSEDDAALPPAKDSEPSADVGGPQ